MIRLVWVLLLLIGLAASPARAEEPNLEAGLKAFAAADLAGVQWHLVPLADKGDVQALRAVGLTYLDGRMTPADPDRAVKYLQKAAAAGDVDSQYEMAHLYMEGRGVVVDADQMVKWLKASADRKHPKAMYEYALLLMSGRYVAKDEALGIRYIAAAADAGMPLAMNQLGMAYYTGQIPGVPRDLPTAGKWFLATAEQGLPAACYMVAILYAGDEAFGSADLVQSYAWALLARNRTRDKAVRDNAGRLVNTLGMSLKSGQKRDGTRQQKQLDARIPRLTDEGVLRGSERDEDEKDGKRDRTR